MRKKDCPDNTRCKNADKRCIYCDGESQFKAVKYLNGNSFKKYNTPSKKKKGMELEEKTKKLYNKYLARRMPLSGGIDGFEGDVETLRTLIECKQKEVKVGGKKSITIKKKYHDRIEGEARKKGKLPFLVYGFKDENNKEPIQDDMFFAGKFRVFLQLLYLIKYYEEQAEDYKRQLDKMKEVEENAN